MKSNDKTFTKSIREVGYKRNYYNVSQRKDDKHWEKYFSQNIEPFYGDPLRNIITKIMLTSDNYKAEVLTKEDKKILSKLRSEKHTPEPQSLMRIPYPASSLKK
ncbi:DUF4238 domain-containing protein, partial [Streptococcus mutans]|nr:DUF4238 domain-containing protein [Streptococcus mutans]